MTKYSKILYSSVGIALLSACSATSTTQSAPALQTNEFPTKTMSQAAVIADGQQQVELTLKQIMSDPDWLGREPENAFWSSFSAILFSKWFR